MRAAVLLQPRTIVVKDVPDPQAGKGDVVARVRACGICGGALGFYVNGMGKGFGVERILGHEFSGDIAQVGTEVEGWKKGDRVVIEPTLVCWKYPYCMRRQYNLCSSLTFTGIGADGGFAELIKVPAYQLHSLPDGITYEQAALVEPMAVALHAVQRACIKPGDRVAVLGAGPIGLMVIQWTRIGGAGRIFATEVAESRIAAARKAADVVLNPAGGEDVVKEIMEQTEGLGPDVVFECTGGNEAEAQSMTLARKGGRVIILGVPHQKTSVSFGLFLKEISVTGAFAYASLLGSGEFATCLDFIASGRIDTSLIPTTKISLEHIASEGFE